MKARLSWSNKTSPFYCGCFCCVSMQFLRSPLRSHKLLCDLLRQQSPSLHLPDTSKNLPVPSLSVKTFRAFLPQVRRWIYLICLRVSYNIWLPLEWELQILFAVFWIDVSLWVTFCLCEQMGTTKLSLGCRGVLVLGLPFTMLTSRFWVHPSHYLFLVNRTAWLSILLLMDMWQILTIIVRSIFLTL